MYQLNAMILADWTSSAAESARSPKDAPADERAADHSVSFQKLMGQKGAKKAEPQGGKQKTDGQANAAEKDLGQEDLCQTVAASLAALSNPSVPILMQSQTAASEQAAAAVAVVEAALSEVALPGETGQSPLLQTALQGQVRTEAAPANPGLAQPQAQGLETGGNQAEGASLKLVTQTDAKQDAAVTPGGAQTEGAELKQGQSGQQERNGDVQVQSGQTTSAQTLFRGVETAPVKVGDPQLESAQAQDQTGELAHQITKALGQGEQRVEMHLVPENLGSVVVDLTWKQDGSLHVTLHTSTARAAALLMEHAGELGGMLQNNTQNNVQVEVQRQAESQQSQQNGQSEQNAQQQHSQQEHRQQQREDFLQQLRLGLVSAEEALSG